MNAYSRKRAAGRILLLCSMLGLVAPRILPQSSPGADPKTPIHHLVVIFQENVSFDHYFGTYPVAMNPAGEPKFVAAPGTPTVHGLTAGLIAQNQNEAAPFRLDRSHAATCDQDHSYTDEQKAYNSGLVNKFVEFTGNGSGGTCKASDVMGYFDGNTVTALWNYAQHFAMSDNSFGSGFGPSSPGALNLVSGQTHGADANVPGDTVDGTVISDPQPRFDKCDTREVVGMTGTNVGNLLNAHGITWGWFQGGFADCTATHIGSNGAPIKDYIPHHEPFQYYQSTANQQHLPPSSVAMIGHTDQASHQYDISEFWQAVEADNMPAVSFLKAPAFQDGHAGYSDPLAEQTFLVNTINKLQSLPQWESTAVIISYDDSDGWYDHAMPPIVNQSNTPADALTGPGACGQSAPGSIQGRCGYGPRLPLLVISPFARTNFVDHSLTDQSSILRFIEDNWNLGRIGGGSLDAIAGSLFNMFDFHHEFAERLILDPSTGEPRGDDSEDSGR
jgi:phospholipase C